MKEILDKKRAEYTPEGDRLSNLKDIGLYTKVSPERVSLVLAAKHMVSISDLLRLRDNGHVVELGMWEEKLIDIANYLVLLYALIVEQETISTN